jgi:serine/threonine-protein kinase
MSEAKYRILKELGAGGMGWVHKGLLIGQAGFQRPIVIKQLKQAEPEHLRLFVEEARRYALLDHENIGRIFDFERVRGELCIILEYIDGWTLVEYLERHRELGYLPDVDLSVFIAPATS